MRTVGLTHNEESVKAPQTSPVKKAKKPSPKKEQESEQVPDGDAE